MVISRRPSVPGIRRSAAKLKRRQQDRKLPPEFNALRKRGELRQRYHEGQEDQLGALGLVVNIIVLWNTLYINAALQQLEQEGFEIQSEDIVAKTLCSQSVRKRGDSRLIEQRTRAL